MRFRRPRPASHTEPERAGSGGDGTTIPSVAERVTPELSDRSSGPAFATGVVPVHPEAVDDDPLALRWVVPPGTLAVRGVVSRTPAALAALVDSGEIATIEAAADAVTIRLAPGGSWRESGSRVRSALGEALREPEGWAADAGRIEGPDAALAEAAVAAIDGEAGDYVRSHGGQIEFVGAHDGRVDVRLSGACGHCPAATATLRFRIEKAVREAYPDLVEVRQV